MSFVLLLTGTIKPFKGQLHSGRIDVSKREDDYFKAINFYLSKGFEVVFVENSDYSSKKIQSIKEKSKSFEYHTFLSKRSYLGKSFGEMEIFKFALENSTALNKVDYLIKITGRYIIKNISQLLSGVNGVDHEIYVNPTRNLRWADTRLMIIKKSFYYNYFLPCADKYLDESKGVYLENIQMKAILLYLVDGGELQLWPLYPAYDAYDGTHDEKVKFNLLKTLKYNLYFKFKKFVFKHRA
ncbi:MAG: hypothetical protein ACQEW9_03400 [Bacteroidota bacterium]|uniref:Uncharacterized protein n=1 Tax=Algoriphagus faecimaris TaxID=686796 RepID=A0A1G6PVB9_9BACT|nr:hypothetical protein [Algoriphagus faecimaris]SDC84152.1 hypothetical protein SAMN04488104_100773 [Algoriphagus faecimaris]